MTERTAKAVMRILQKHMFRVHAGSAGNFWYVDAELPREGFACHLTSMSDVNDMLATARWFRAGVSKKTNFYDWSSANPPKS